MAWMRPPRPNSGSRASSTRPSRSYDGTLRRERAAETRERILDAGSELIHRSAVRDWKKLTVRAVAERAGVNERTVYRYFGSERGLHDAVLDRNREEAGIELEGMRLEDVATVAARILDHVAQYPREPPPALDPTLMAAKDRQHQALLDAVAAEVGRAPGPPAGDGGRRARCPLERGQLRAPGRRLVHRPRAGGQGDHLGHRTGRSGRAEGRRADMMPDPDLDLVPIRSGHQPVTILERP